MPRGLVFGALLHSRFAGVTEARRRLSPFANPSRGQVMRWSDIPFHPPEKTLRQFAAAGVVLVAILVLSLVYQEADWRLVASLIGFGIAWGILGLLFPKVLRPVFVGWMCLTFPIGWLLSHLVLAFLYFCIFTPVGCFFGLIGRDLLARRQPSGSVSYWKPRLPPSDLPSYFHQG
jgi:hypothetical protein